MKRRLKENIEIGDRVFAPRDEYQGTVVDINGDEVLVDGPFGEEYHNLSDLKKLGGDYEEGLPFPFRENFTESRKKIIRLTESDLARIVKRVIRETKEVDEVFDFFKRGKNDNNNDYVKVKKFKGKHDVKLIQREGVDVYVDNDNRRNGRVEFTFGIAKFENGNEDRIELRGIYHRNSNKLRVMGTDLDIDNNEQDRLNNKYFD